MPSLTTDQLHQVAETFHRDGFARVPGVLDDSLVASLRQRTDVLLDDPQLAARENPELHDRHYAQAHTSATGERIPFILRNTIELDPLFLAMLEHETILPLAEAIVGPGARFCAQCGTTSCGARIS